jgi:hypothetical protein
MTKRRILIEAITEVFQNPTACKEDLYVVAKTTVRFKCRLHSVGLLCHTQTNTQASSIIALPHPVETELFILTRRQSPPPAVSGLPSAYRTYELITVITGVGYLTLSCIIYIQFIPTLFGAPGSVVVKALCYKPKVTASRPDEVNDFYGFI